MVLDVGVVQGLVRKTVFYVIWTSTMSGGGTGAARIEISGDSCLQQRVPNRQAGSTPILLD